MIISDINRLDNLPHLRTVFQDVISIDLINLSSGEHLLEGQDLFLNRVSTTSRKMTGSKSEIHRDYIDIHLLLSGKETLGYCVKPATEAFMSNSAFNNDCELVEELVDEQFLTLNEKQFVIFYPGVWHRPMLTIDKISPIEKVVIKIHKNYIKK